jgi:hypothetical protein
MGSLPEHRPPDGLNPSIRDDTKTGAQRKKYTVSNAWHCQAQEQETWPILHGLDRTEDIYDGVCRYNPANKAVKQLD